MSMIKLVNVNKYYGDLYVLKDVPLEVEEGEKLVIIGPSGSGKSTTVRCINFLEVPSSGHVYIDGKELTVTHNTQHSDAILTDSASNAKLFASAAPSACVYVNASTRFSGGGQFGLGAEVAISTQKMHARGPMALEELTTYRMSVRVTI